MIKKIHFFELIIILLLISFFSSCNFFLSLIGDAIESDFIAVQPASSQTTLGSAIQFKAILQSRNSGDIEITTEAQWSSSDPEIATVSDKGVVYTGGLGTAVITATRGTIHGTGKIVVKAVPPTPTPTPMPTPTPIPTPRPTSNPPDWSILADNINKQAPALSGHLNNNYLYIGTGGAGSSLKIYDASDPPDLKLASTLNLTNPPEDMAASGNYVYIANHYGLTIVNASNPHSPQIINSIPVMNASGVFVRANYAYMATAAGLTVIQNTLNPVTAKVIGSCSTGGFPARRVAVSGNYAYLATSGGVAVVNISIPNNPHYENTSGITGNNRDIVIYDNYVYYTNSDSNVMRVLDVTDPLSPAPTAMPINGSGYGIALNGTTGYVTGSNLVWRFDISATEPWNLSVSGSVSTYQGSLGAVPDDNYVYVINEYYGITTIDFNTGSIVKQTAVPDRAVNVAVSGNYAYIADNRGGLQIIDNIDSPSTAKIVNTVKLNDYVVDVAVSGNYAYAAVRAESGFPDGPELQVLNISDPLNVSVVGSLDIPLRTAVSIDVLGSLAFLGTDNSMVVIDISDPAVPSQIDSSFSTGYIVNDIKAAGDYVYLANSSNGLNIVNVSTPDSPSSVCTVPYGSAYALEVDNNYCYLVDGGGLRIIDITDPASASQIGYYDTTGAAQGVAIRDGYAFIADGADGIVVLDITSPNTPGLVKTIGSIPPIDANTIVVTPWYGYVAAGADGLLILGE